MLKKYDKFVENLNMINLILLIGLSGSGKSTWIKNNKSKWINTIVICPDEIRKELTGNVSDQSKNKEVFELTKMLTIYNLKKGNNVVLDATNLDTVYRIPFVNDVNKEVKFNKISLVFYVSKEEAKQRIKKDIENNIDRANVPDDIIDAQYQKYINSLKSLPEEGFKIVTSWNEDQ